MTIEDQFKKIPESWMGQMMLEKNELDTNILLQLMTKAVCYVFADDPTRPGVTVSYLQSGQFYVSVVRYHEAFAKGKAVVYHTKHKEFEKALLATATWLSKQKMEDNPIEQLRTYLSRVS